MSALIFRNNLSKFYFKSCFARNFKCLQRNNYYMSNISKLLQLQRMPANHIIRGVSLKSITIKQYESSRKYTVTWKLERLMGWSLIVLIPLSVGIESKELEMVLSTVALLHTYWGCQSVCSDYLRSSVVGKVLPVIVRLSIVFLCIISLFGSYQLIYQDVGLIKMIKKFWLIRGRDYMPSKH